MDALITPDNTEGDESDHLRDKVAHLQLGLASARRIGAAVGIVMAVKKVSYEDAFVQLCRRSQVTNTKLRDVAEQVIYTGLL